MKTLELTIPTLYGDHHTTAVLGILEKIKGVSEVYVSSAFHQAVIKYEPKTVQPEAIKQALADHGYEANGSELTSPAYSGDQKDRHTATFPGTGDTLSFTDEPLSWKGRPLWPLPGMPPLPNIEEE